MTFMMLRYHPIGVSNHDIIYIIKAYNIDDIQHLTKTLYSSRGHIINGRDSIKIIKKK